MTRILPYGDRPGDGAVQLSFTLPVRSGETARAAAVEMCEAMGLIRPQVVHMKGVGSDFTFVIVYASSPHSVDTDDLEVAEPSASVSDYEEINRTIRRRLGRRLVVLGACTGSDAHTVGLDAILSMKGFAGDHGLEYFSEFEVVNLGAQVDPRDLVDRVIASRPDAVLISQVVTQRDAHLVHLRNVREALEGAGLRSSLILVGGGPRLTPDQAAELGYDRIFGRGTRPGEVAAYLVNELVSRMGNGRGAPGG